MGHAAADAHWFLRALAPRRAPIPWAAAGRAALALAGPLAVGVATGRVAYGVLASLGALNMVVLDRDEAYRLRVIRMVPPQLAGALGIVMGHQVADRGWTTVSVLVATALLSGVISPIGGIASSCGLMLLLMTVVGTGVPMPDPWWLPPALLIAGGAGVLLLALVAWPWRRGRPERAAVAEVYYAAADRLRAAEGPGRRPGAGRDIGAAIDQAYDVLVRHRAGSPGRDPATQHLMIQLNAVNPILEAIAALARETPVDPKFAEAVTRLGDAVATGHDVAVEPGFVPKSPAETAMRAALRHAAGRLAPPSPDATGVFARDPDALGVPHMAWGPRAGLRNMAAVVASRAAWTYGARLALCIGIASVLVQVADLPRSYWVALTITFVLKPDFGSVFVRGVLRAAGTLVGVAVAAALLTYVPRGWPDVPVVAALGFLLPIATSRSYGMQTAAITPLMLLFTDQLGHEGVGGLVPARILDTLLGCAIVLVFGYLLWPEGRRTRLPNMVASASEANAAYLRLLLAEGADGRAVRSRARRRAYNTLTGARTVFQQALAEPPPTSRRAAAFWPVLVAVERMTDSITAASAYVDGGAPVPDQRTVDDVADRIDAFVRAVGAGRPVDAGLGARIDGTSARLEGSAPTQGTASGGTPADAVEHVTTEGSALLNGVRMDAETACKLYDQALSAVRMR
ncbi:FUSC family protein [Yinghuangia sp. YIM S09857]|uniref:FUSC family protein n=1 Tax=Yinghuangia sp. YIM S09857 TaxID=3436929 RepID=UPI003F53ACBF